MNRTAEQFMCIIVKLSSCCMVELWHNAACEVLIWLHLLTNSTHQCCRRLSVFTHECHEFVTFVTIGWALRGYFLINIFVPQASGIPFSTSSSTNWSTKVRRPWTWYGFWCLVSLASLTLIILGSRYYPVSGVRWPPHILPLAWKKHPFQFFSVQIILFTHVQKRQFQNGVW